MPAVEKNRDRKSFKNDEHDRSLKIRTVLPTRGHSGLKRVVRHAPCPVLIPRGKKFKAATRNGQPAGKFELRKTLAPVDFSDCSLAGVNYAAVLANRFGAKLRLFPTIYPYTRVFAADRVTPDVTPLFENARRHTEEQMNKLRQLVSVREVSGETEICGGSAIDEICGDSGRADIDLVAASTHGRTGLKRALIGRVAEHVVRHAERPIIIVPSPGDS